MLCVWSVCCCSDPSAEHALMCGQPCTAPPSLPLAPAQGRQRGPLQAFHLHLHPHLHHHSHQQTSQPHTATHCCKCYHTPAHTALSVTVRVLHTHTYTPVTHWCDTSITGALCFKCYTWTPFQPVSVLVPVHMGLFMNWQDFHWGSNTFWLNCEFPSNNHTLCTRSNSR